jgi:methionyl-tRNA formyltransferase
MGTPEFSIPSLESLFKSHWDLIGVVTQPDRPQGRGSKVIPSPVKKKGIEYQLPIYQPIKVKDPEFLGEIRTLAPDIIVVVAFGQILPKSILEIPPLGCINVHASLLPLYRGAAPIQWAIIKGEKETGVTTIKMNEAMDEGDILDQKSLPIGDQETAGELFTNLSIQGANLLQQTLKKIETHSLTPQKQDHQKASYAPSLKKEDGRIMWEKSAEQIVNLIRGTDPWPGAFTFLGSKRLRIWRATAEPLSSFEGKPGKISAVTSESLEVVTGKGILLIQEIQPENKRRMEVKEFLAGYSITENTVLGR